MNLTLAPESARAWIMARFPNWHGRVTLRGLPVFFGSIFNIAVEQLSLSTTLDYPSIFCQFVNKSLTNIEYFGIRAKASRNEILISRDLTWSKNFRKSSTLFSCIAPLGKGSGGQYGLTGSIFFFLGSCYIVVSSPRHGNCSDSFLLRSSWWSYSTSELFLLMGVRWVAIFPLLVVIARMWDPFGFCSVFPGSLPSVLSLDWLASCPSYFFNLEDGRLLISK